MPKPRTQQEFDEQLVARVNAVIGHLGKVVKLVAERPDLLDQERLHKAETALVNQTARAIQNIQSLVAKNVDSLRPFRLDEEPEPILASRIEPTTPAPMPPPRTTRAPSDEGVDFIDPDE